MTKTLIIVESPTKIKTLKKFLGPQYFFESSLGHVRDLPTKGFGIDVEHDFEPQYTVMEEKKDVLARLKKAAKSADIIYLAPDPDREGEAIAWHIASILPPGTKYKRVTFNAITRSAVQDALRHPRDIDHALVDAQQARRLLDRIVGYKISPILTRRVQGGKAGGLSAGRVQSVALKLVVDREREIEAFRPVEYWNLGALLKTEKKAKAFHCYVHTIDDKRVEKEPQPDKPVVTIGNAEVAHAVATRLKRAKYHVASIEKKEKKRNPVPPFITSTLQQEASRHYGFSAQRTMTIAQSLYEGVELGQEGAEGLITYMRTDSVRTSSEAIVATRQYVGATYGKEFLPEEPRVFATKKTAQDAHEAIRPTNLIYVPDGIKDYLTADQYKLYVLIWRRFLASQMTPAVYDTISCDIATDQGILLRATGSTLKERGFLAVYEEKQDKVGTEEGEEHETSRVLPSLASGQLLHLHEVLSQQAFTRPPPRFTEASLVKELEKSGIGRPSTYAAIMNKIQSRDYTIKEKGTLKPTELGKVIAKMLEDNFRVIMDIHFTAAMENDLEYIEEKKRNWKELIRQFWNDFIPFVEQAEKEAFVPKEMTEHMCPQCSRPLQKIWSRNKYFYGCSHYPECKYTMPLEALEFKKEDYDPQFDWAQKCSKCHSDMQLRFSRFGPFLGCTRYPECKGVVSIRKKDELSMDTVAACPAIGCDGRVTQRRSRFGKPFFSCSNYPDCDVIVNQIDELADKYPNHPKTPCVKKANTRRGRKKNTDAKGAAKTRAKKRVSGKDTQK